MYTEQKSTQSKQKEIFPLHETILLVPEGSLE